MKKYAIYLILMYCCASVQTHPRFIISSQDQQIQIPNLPSIREQFEKLVEKYQIKKIAENYNSTSSIEEKFPKLSRLECLDIFGLLVKCWLYNPSTIANNPFRFSEKELKNLIVQIKKHASKLIIMAKDE